MVLMQQIFTDFAIQSFDRFVEFITAPIEMPEMLWILVPLILNILIMELYFGRYVLEELGWNTAFSNVIVLIFVSVDLLRYLYNAGRLELGIELALICAIILVGIVLTILDFFHELPKHFAFVVSSKLPMNYLALVSIILIYSGINILEAETIIALLLFLLLLYVIIKLIHAIVPKSLEV